MNFFLIAQFQTYLSIMHHVLSVMLLTELHLSWFQLKLDVHPETIAGTSSNTNPSLFYHTVTDCNGLSCPPYENNRILLCTVCTK